MADQMDLSFEGKEADNDVIRGSPENGSCLYFGELIQLLDSMLSGNPSDDLACLVEYLKQTSEHIQSGLLSEDDAKPLEECFEIAAKSAQLCTRSLCETNPPGTGMDQLKEVFYLANDLFTQAHSQSLQRDLCFTKLGDMFSFLKSCQKLDVKLFLQAVKMFVGVIERNQSQSGFSSHDLVVFLQSIVLDEFLCEGKRSQTALKVTGFVLRNLAAIYSGRLGPTLLSEHLNVVQVCRFLIKLNTIYVDLAKSGDSDALTVAFRQFVVSSFAIILQPLVANHLFLPCLCDGFEFADLAPASLKSGWICLVVNVFVVLGDSKTICQTLHVERLLDCFIRKYCEWAVDDSASEDWPWPVIGQAKLGSAHELCAVATARFVLRSVLEEASQFFQFEQLLILGLTGKAKPVECSPVDVYPILARVFISDVVAFLAKSSYHLAFRYTLLLADFISKTADNDDIAAHLVPALLRRIFDSVSDDHKSRLVEQTIDEMKRSFANLVPVPAKRSAVFSMTDSVRLLEAAANALVSNGQPMALLVIAIRLFCYLTWWTTARPEAMKGSRQLVEKLTFTMWQILSMAVVENSSTTPSLLILFAQSVFEASRTVIIGVGNYETAAKFWQAAGQFFEKANLPPALRQLFVVWLLKTVDSNTLACSPGAQKVIEKALSDVGYGGEGSSASLLHGVVLSNLANRLNPKLNATAEAISSRLDPKLRVQAEAFNQQLFCIPFSKLT